MSNSGNPLHTNMFAKGVSTESETKTTRGQCHVTSVCSIATERNFLRKQARSMNNQQKNSINPKERLKWKNPNYQEQCKQKKYINGCPLHKSLWRSTTTTNEISGIKWKQSLQPVFCLFEWLGLFVVFICLLFFFYNGDRALYGRFLASHDFVPQQLYVVWWQCCHQGNEGPFRYRGLLCPFLAFLDDLAYQKHIKQIIPKCLHILLYCPIHRTIIKAKMLVRDHSLPGQAEVNSDSLTSQKPLHARMNNEHNAFC